MIKPQIYQRYPFNLHAYFTRGIIWGQRKIFGSRPGAALGIVPTEFASAEAANDAITDLLTNDNPCMIARFGSVEKDAFERAFDREFSRGRTRAILNMILGRAGPFWFDNSVRRTMNTSAGFFPPSDEMLARFYTRVKKDCKLIDLHASWYPGEQRIKQALYPTARTCSLCQLEPFFSARPWTKALAGKKVLLVHPFATTIQKQYAHRQDLFDDPDFLPAFELQTYKPVVSHCTEVSRFKNWFEALESMSNDIHSLDFDIAILGCGAYGLSLAAEIKRMGRKAFHLGGATQLLFGIKGRRWENSNGRNKTLFRDSWCRPSDAERPQRSDLMENHAYW